MALIYTKEAEIGKRSITFIISMSMRLGRGHSLTLTSQNRLEYYFVSCSSRQIPFFLVDN